jgi:hypothetical protein
MANKRKPKTYQTIGTGKIGNVGITGYVPYPLGCEKSKNYRTAWIWPHALFFGISKPGLIWGGPKKALSKYLDEPQVYLGNFVESDIAYGHAEDGTWVINLDIEHPEPHKLLLKGLTLAKIDDVLPPIFGMSHKLLEDAKEFDLYNDFKEEIINVRTELVNAFAASTLGIIAHQEDFYKNLHEAAKKAKSKADAENIPLFMETVKAVRDDLEYHLANSKYKLKERYGSDVGTWDYLKIYKDFLSAKGEILFGNHYAL